MAVKLRIFRLVISGYSYDVVKAISLFFYVKINFTRTSPSNTRVCHISEVNWGSSTQANAYKDALKTTLKLIKVDDHVKNFRPQILVLTGYPRNRPSLVDFAASITKKQSLLICGHVFQVRLYYYC